jgi:PAS domain S-box-containing protein
MITVAMLAGRSEQADRLSEVLAEYATVFELEPEAGASLVNMPVDVVVLEGQPLTDRVIGLLGQVKATHPNSVTVCAASEEVAERARIDGLLSPDFWVIASGSAAQLRAQIEPIMSFVTAGGRRAIAEDASGEAGSDGPLLSGLSGASSGSAESSLHRMVRRMAGSSDMEQILSAYCDAVHEETRCVSYCLLWQEPEQQEFSVVRCEALAPVLESNCRLAVSDALPAWLYRTRGVVTRESLRGPRRARVLREMEMYGGAIAAPLFCQAVLRGIMIVGPKAIGEAYTPGEAEGLFMLSASAAAAARQAELHRELEARNKYIAQVLSTMESGLITLGTDGKVRVFNPYAARVLSLEAEDVLGRDLRALPSPLGDMLYACLAYDGEEVSREEVAVLGGQVAVRVSTRRLGDSRGLLMGSMMLLEDITAEHALAEERRKAERTEIINQIVARVAHELKNPLATIYTFAEVLPATFQDAEFQHWSELVRRDVRRLDDLVTKLVSLAESPDFNREIVEVLEIVGHAVARLEQLDETARSYVALRMSGELPMVRVDTNIMAAALSHLLRYALGVQHRTVTVEARLEAGAGAERPIIILVTSPADPERMDDPQLLLDPAYVLEHPEIDLGPSASQRLIEGQGGQLGAYYENGNLVFRISLAPCPDPARI